MPLWFKCIECGQIYYTANSFNKNKNTCEKCGGNLISSKNKQEIIDENDDKNKS